MTKEELKVIKKAVEDNSERDNLKVIAKLLILLVEKNIKL